MPTDNFFAPVVNACGRTRSARLTIRGRDTCDSDEPVCWHSSQSTFRASRFVLQGSWDRRAMPNGVEHRRTLRAVNWRVRADRLRTVPLLVVLEALGATPDPHDPPAAHSLECTAEPGNGRPGRGAVHAANRRMPKQHVASGVCDRAKQRSCGFPRAQR